MYLDGSAKTKDGIKFKFHDPDLKYSVGDESNSYLRINIFEDDNQELDVNLKISGDYYNDRIDNIMDFIKSFDESDFRNISYKTLIRIDPIVSSVFNLSPHRII